MTRRAMPSYQPWTPLPYMQRAVDFLATHHSAGIPLKPGGRKTSITLAAFSRLKAEGTVRKMLVIAPLRVCRQVWRQEGAKWAEFRHLRFSLLHGPKKDDALKADADVYLINPEGVPWLAKKFFGRSIPFDVLCIDELTRFKNHDSDRSKALRPRLKHVRYRWGLTGSLAPNGYMDLFGQMLMLDDGAALGRYITHYRDQYFTLDYDGFTYNLMPGAEKRIVAKLAPYWLPVDERDYGQLPPLVNNPIMLDLEPAARKHYNKMKSTMIAELPGGVVTAANQAAVYSKLSQMANGAVYLENHQVEHIHDVKLDALEELVEELNGEPLLVGYEFNHDLDRLRERFGVPDKAGKKVLPYLGKGTTSRQETEWVEAWNRGELPILAAHPASAGHGLNMQGANAFNVAWFGVTWDFELYDQFIRRIWRDGNKAVQVFNHLLIVKDSLDVIKLAALDSKDMVQGKLIFYLTEEILRDAKARTGGEPVFDDRRLPTMVAPRLPKQAETPERGAVPKGWGGGGTPAQDDQRARVQEKIAPEPEAEEAPAPRNVSSAFSRGTLQAAEAITAQDVDQGDQGDQAPAPAPAPKTRTRGPKAVAPQAEPLSADGFVEHGIKLEILKLAFADPNTDLEGGLEIAKDLLHWVREG